MAKHPSSADHGPIAAEHHAMLNGLAHALGEMFNGENCKPEDRKVWFFLAAGNFNDPNDRFNYISNADRLDVRAVLHDVLARIEARMGETGKA